MKKIMFNDRYGLTKAVLEGRKTMTRRLVPEGTPFGSWEETLKKSRYQIGEVVAVGQSLRDMGYNPRDTKHKSGAIWGLDHTPAWTNKMFVSASECVHQIRITNIRIERLQDISDEDCIKEGVMSGCKIYMDLADRECCGPTTYAIDCCDEDFLTPQSAFSYLIDKVSGKGVWDSNPYVFVYEFELIR